MNTYDERNPDVPAMTRQALWIAAELVTFVGPKGKTGRVVSSGSGNGRSDRHLQRGVVNTLDDAGGRWALTGPGRRRRHVRNDAT
jgi:hypothetical protein